MSDARDGIVPDDGRRDAPIVLIGEADAREEMRLRRHFVGPSGKLLERWWRDVGLTRRDMFVTNVVPYRPMPSGKPDQLPRDELDGWIAELHEKLARHEGPQGAGPNVIVPTGSVALRALTGKDKITKWRGSVLTYTDARGRTLKVIPTIHPAATFREPWLERPCRRDWARIAEDARFPETRLPERTYYIKPTLDDVEWFVESVRAQDIMSIDIETPRRASWTATTLKSGKPGVPKRVLGEPYVSCVGFSVDPAFGMCVPTDATYWGSKSRTARAWEMVRALCESPNEKVLQNGLFDAWWLMRDHGVRVRNYRWDLKAMHHVLDPSDAHDLGYMLSCELRYVYHKDEAKDPDEIQKYASDADAFWTYNCLTLDTPILRADLTECPLGAVNVGDRLLCVSAEPDGSRYARKIKFGYVMRVSDPQLKSVLNVKLTDGSTLCGTADHRVLARRGRKRFVWRHLSELLPNEELKDVVRGGVDNSRDAGWLAGILDGEGCLIQSTKGHIAVSISQKAGLVLDRVKLLLAAMGVSVGCTHARKDGVTYLTITGRDALRLLARTQPVRLMEKFVGVTERGFYGLEWKRRVRVVSIEPAGEKYVRDITTSCSTFVANGIAVHNCMDATYQRELFDVLHARLIASGALPRYLRDYRNLHAPLLALSLHGIAIDAERRGEREAALLAAVAEVRAEVTAHAGTELYGKKALSPKKLANYLYDVLRLPRQWKRNARGDATVTTSEVVVRRLMARFPAKLATIGDAILRQRRTQQLLTFVRESRVDDDGRMRSSYGFSPESGRLSSTRAPNRKGGNAQNVDREIRDVYVPDACPLCAGDGCEACAGSGRCVFVEGDYSQGESRIVAALISAVTGDASMLARARAPVGTYDEHRELASVMFGVRERDVTKEQRYVGKRTNHAVNYDMHGRTHSEQLSKEGYTYSPEECEAFIELARRMKPGLGDWHRSIRIEIMRKRALVNAFGTMILFKHERLNDELYRRGYAFKPQSGLAKLMNIHGFGPLHRWIVHEGVPARINAHLHDGVLVSVPAAWAYDVAAWMFANMVVDVEWAPEAGVAIPIEVSVRARWGTRDGDPAPVAFAASPERGGFDDSIRETGICGADTRVVGRVGQPTRAESGQTR